MVALRECMYAAGHLTPETYLKQVVRHRSVAPQVEAFNSALQMREIALLIARHAGPLACRSTSVASTFMHSAAQISWPNVKDLREECIYICGGSQSRDVHAPERFNVSRGTWESLPCMNENRVGGVACILSGSLYVCGGASTRGVLNSVERFDPITSSLSAAP